MAAQVKTCLILGSAPTADISYIQDFLGISSFIICADGGFELAKRCGIKPDLLIGDFDSYKGELPENTEIVRLPVMKDDTDSMAAVKLALERGYKNLILAGVLGGRADHSFANFCVLQYIAKMGAKGQLADASTRVFYLSDDVLTLSGLKGKTVSIFPFACRRCVVTYKGLLYPLTEQALYTDVSPMGVSNKIIEDEAAVYVHEGNALVMVLLRE